VGTIESLVLRFHGQRAREESLRLAAAAERARLAEGEAPDTLAEEVARAIGGPHALPFGAFLEGQALGVIPSLALQGGLCIGAPGSGKTRFLLAQIMTQLRWNLGLPSFGVAPPPGWESEVELLDPKSETFFELKMSIAAEFLCGSEATRKALRRFVRVFDWSRERVCPFAPFDNAAGTVSDAFLAHQRVDVEVAASGQTYTDGVQQLYFMVARLLVARRFPPNLRFFRKFLRNAAFRLRVIEGVADRDVASYFRSLEDTVANQTIEAFLRRMQRALCFPELILSIGIPPATLDRLLPRMEPRLTIGNFGPGQSLPAGKAIEQASHRVIDLLRWLPRRDTRRPGLVIFEEAAVLLSLASELTEPLANAARSLRSFKWGVWYAAQDFSNALRKPLVRTLLLNSKWIVLFQSRDEAEWLAGFADEMPAFTGTTAQKKAAFVHEVQNLPTRHAYLYVKGHRPVRFVTTSFPSASEVAGGVPDDELVAIFDREIAPASTIPAAVAEEAILRWENEVVGPEEASKTPGTSAAKSRRSPGIADLLADLEGDES
jgi:hypothetical protein